MLELGYSSDVIQSNDSEETTHTDVMNWFNRAIEMAQALSKDHYEENA